MGILILSPRDNKSAIQLTLCKDENFWANFFPYYQQVEFVQELPKTISGKIKRNELRKKEWETI